MLLGLSNVGKLLVVNDVLDFLCFSGCAAVYYCDATMSGSCAFLFSTYDGVLGLV